MARHAGGDDAELEKRAATVSGIIRKTVYIAIWVVGLVMGVRELGFDVGPILAGAGSWAWPSASARRIWCAT